jgi:RNA polymerase sigma-70 factor, ECF subfamily
VSSLHASANAFATTSIAIDEIYRRDSRRVFATLIRLFGGFDLAEEALQDGFRAAIEQWPTQGIPENPVAWLVSTGRFKAIDRIRRDARFESVNASLETERRYENIADPTDASDGEASLQDDRLRLIFTCCHPALAQDAQIALTLREVCGLKTEEIARAFLTTAATIAQRIVRAKAKIRDAKIAYEVPEGDALQDRLHSVQRVIYLVYNEAYLSTTGGDGAASAGAASAELVSEAIYLGRLILKMCASPDSMGLLALMLLQESRRATRFDEHGELRLLEAQDRTRWDRAMIEAGIALVRAALRRHRLAANRCALRCAHAR